MKKPVAIISGVAAVLGATCVAYCPSAMADPACPYDMSTPAGRNAEVAAMVAASNQVRSDQVSYGPMGNQDLADKDAQVEADNSRMVLACSGASASSQAMAQADQTNANEVAVAQRQSEMPPPPPPPDGPPGMDCAGMDDSINSAGPLNDIANRLSGGLLGKIQSAPLAVCGATNAAIGVVAPNDFNQSQAATGFCDAANQAFNPISGVNPCGNTPAG